MQQVLHLVCTESDPHSLSLNPCVQLSIFFWIDIFPVTSQIQNEQIEFLHSISKCVSHPAQSLNISHKDFLDASLLWVLSASVSKYFGFPFPMSPKLPSLLHQLGHLLVFASFPRLPFSWIKVTSLDALPPIVFSQDDLKSKFICVYQCLKLCTLLLIFRNSLLWCINWWFHLTQLITSMLDPYLIYWTSWNRLHCFLPTNFCLCLFTLECLMSRFHTCVPLKDSGASFTVSPHMSLLRAPSTPTLSSSWVWCWFPFFSSRSDTVNY